MCHHKSELYYSVTQLAVSSPDLPLAHQFASLFFVSNLVITEQWSNGKHCIALTFRRFCELLTAGEDVNPIKMKQYTSDFIPLDCHEITSASHCCEKIRNEFLIIRYPVIKTTSFYAE